jgi:hypothetical protein
MGRPAQARPGKGLASEAFGGEETDPASISDVPEIELLHQAFPQGVSEAFLVHASDRRSYAAKFKEKAQYGPIGQAREILAGSLAEIIGASVPRTQVLRLTQALLDAEPAIQFRDGTRPAAGLASGSAFLGKMVEPPIDHAARLSLCPVADPAGIVAFNMWVAATDRHWDNYAFYWEASGIRFASIDYADAFDVRRPGLADQDQVVAVARANPTVLETFVARIEAVTDEQLRCALAEVPDDMAHPTQKTAIFDFVCGSRSDIRAMIGGLIP